MDLKDESILDELKCLICREYLCAPINICSIGHSMCDKCRKQLTVCPICDAPMGNARNFTLENVVAKFKLPCKYRDSGCTFLEAGFELKIHEEFCEYGEIVCPLKESYTCPWTGKLRHLPSHASTSEHHLSQVANNREHCLKGIFRFVGDKKWFSLVSAHAKTFKYCFNIDYINTMLIKWNVQFVGPRNEANNYSYVITFIDKSKKKKKFSVISPCEPLGSDKHAFESSICVNHNQLKLFHSTNDSLYFYFKIVLTRDLDNVVPTNEDNSKDETASTSQEKRTKLSDYRSSNDSSKTLKECVNLPLVIPVNDNSSDADSD